VLIDDLLGSEDPAVRWRLMVRVLGEDPASQRSMAVEQEVKDSPRVRSLLAGLNTAKSVYAKWQGAHWVLATLADIGYPSGDEALAPVAQQVLEAWLQDRFYAEFEARSKAEAYKKRGVALIQGRYRRCASQQGNALYFLSKLGLIDQFAAGRLVERLLHWQWPDGGWNCDKNPQADSSSIMETVLPMCGLHLFGRETQTASAVDAARRAAEVLLTRRLFKRRSDGTAIHPEFISLHYPLYWHYDFLGGLKAMAEVGLIDDPRCADALDLLEQKELSGGGWPAEKRYYKVTRELELHADYVDWGGASKATMNAWVTTDALYVLRQAGRI
jgi:hypothetical protein